MIRIFNLLAFDDGWSYGQSFAVCRAVASAVASAVGFLRNDSNRSVQVVKVLGSGAIDVEPPVADEDLLVEYGSVRAQERKLAAVMANMEHLNNQRQPPITW